MKVTGPMFSVDARGGIFNSIVYAAWRGINYIREFAMPTNPQTIRQMLIRGFLTTASRAWIALTDVQRNLWRDFADTLTYRTQIGQSYNPTGIAVYVGLSVIAQDQLQVPVLVPPTTPAPVQLAGAAAVTGVLASGDIDCSWTGADGDSVDIQCTRALSPGEVAGKNLYRHVDYVVIATGVYVISGLAPATKYGVRMRAVRFNGQDGPFTKFEVISKA